MISISELLENIDNVKPAVWAEVEAEIKKRIDDAAQKFVNNYFDDMLQSGCSYEVIQKCYKTALDLCEVYPILDLLDEDYEELYYENPKDWDLDSYICGAIRNSGKTAAQNLVQYEIKIDKKEIESNPIDYKMLRDVLHNQCDIVLKKYIPTPNDIPIIHDLSDRTLYIFKYINEEICADEELNVLFRKKDSDNIIKRLIYLITKYDGTFIPAPYEDIDDWWGDFNGTINYIVRYYRAL